MDSYQYHFILDITSTFRETLNQERSASHKDAEELAKLKAK